LFFALPFLLLLLRPVQIKAVAIYGFVYLFGHVGVIMWDQVITNSQSAPPEAKTTWETLSAIFSLPNLRELATVWANLVRMVAWQSLALVPLMVIAWRSGKERRWQRILVASFLVSLVPYPFLMPDQGHGWGYRYLHGLIGHLVIIAALGWSVLSAREGSVRFRSFVVSLILVAPLVILPLRAFLIHDYILPYVRGTEYVSTRDTDFVVVDSTRVFLGSDIVRFSPSGNNQPVVLTLHNLPLHEIVALCESHRVEFVGSRQLSALGMHTRSLGVDWRTLVYLSRMFVLHSDQCRRSRGLIDPN